LANNAPEVVYDQAPLETVVALEIVVPLIIKLTAEPLASELVPEIVVEDALEQMVFIVGAAETD
jgi:hypothetical protein